MKLNRRQLRRLIESTLREQIETVKVRTQSDSNGIIEDQTTLQPGEEKKFAVMISYHDGNYDYSYGSTYAGGSGMEFGEFDISLNAVSNSDMLEVKHEGKTYAATEFGSIDDKAGAHGILSNDGLASNIYYESILEEVSAGISPGRGSNIVIVSVKNNDVTPAIVGFTTAYYGS